MHSVSWDDWEDKQSGIKSYAYQIIGVSDVTGRGKATVFTNASALVRSHANKCSWLQLAQIAAVY